MTSREVKARQRAEQREKLAGQSAQTRAAQDEKLIARLMAQPELLAAERVFCYVSVRNEVETHALIRWMQRQGKRVSVPRCEADGIMKAVPLEDLDTLQPAGFSLLEPPAGAPHTQPCDIDLILLPCLSVSADGRRLGQGGGFYDRYLAACNAPRLCLCRQALMREDIPAEPFDLLVDIVITDQNRYDCAAVRGGDSIG